MADNKQTYLGDGAYAEYDGQGELIIYTSDGIRRTNEGVLGASETDGLLQFMSRCGLAEIR